MPIILVRNLVINHPIQTIQDKTWFSWPAWCLTCHCEDLNRNQGPNFLYIFSFIESCTEKMIGSVATIKKTYIGSKDKIYKLWMDQGPKLIQFLDQEPQLIILTELIESMASILKLWLDLQWEFKADCARGQHCFLWLNCWDQWV